MTIKQLGINLGNDDLNRLIDRFLPLPGAISRVRAELQDGRLLVWGRASMFLNINFQAAFSISHTSTEIIARLENLSPASALANQFKKKILQKIADQASFIHLDSDDDEIRINMNEIIEKRVESAALEIIELTTAKDKLTVKLQGEITF